jgi:hypothetical protein
MVFLNAMRSGTGITRRPAANHSFWRKAAELQPQGGKISANRREKDEKRAAETENSPQRPRRV